MFNIRDSGKVRKAEFDILHISIVNVRSKMMEEVASAVELFGKKEFIAACAKLLNIPELGDLLKKQIAMYITQEVKPVFDNGVGTSFSLGDIEKKKEDVFVWINELSDMSTFLQSELMQGKMEAFDKFTELSIKLAHDKRFSDFVNTVRVILQEREIHRIRNSGNVFVSIFRSLNFHPMIKKSSEKLFREGNYAQAIFEGCKVLINFVKDKSGQKMLDGKDLMGKVFGMKCDRGTLQITKNPILQLNDLKSLDEINEQEGFMHLYQGLVIGIRNPKAHAVVDQKDPFRTLEYLSLLSLLVKRVDEAKVNNAN